MKIYPTYGEAVLILEAIDLLAVQRREERVKLAKALGEYREDHPDMKKMADDLRSLASIRHWLTYTMEQEGNPHRMAPNNTLFEQFKP